MNAGRECDQHGVVWSQLIGVGDTVQPESSDSPSAAHLARLGQGISPRSLFPLLKCYDKYLSILHHKLVSNELKLLNEGKVIELDW